MIYATCTASLTVEEFGCDRLESAGVSAIAERAERLLRMITPGKQSGLAEIPAWRHARFVTAKKTFLSKASSIVFALAFLFKACEARPDANGSSPQAVDEANSTVDALRVPSKITGESHGTRPLPSQDAIDRLPRTAARIQPLGLREQPYLLQHARNPIDWRPWGPEAFEEAARLDKPVFLSIGYTTCHWCHVMEHESFEDEEVAALMNKHYACIKVDREERPDADNAT